MLTLLLVDSNSTLDLLPLQVRESTPDALSSVDESIRIIEKEISEKQGLIDSLAARLSEQAHNLTRLRQIAQALRSSQGDTRWRTPNEESLNQLRVRCFGPFRVERGEAEVSLARLGKASMILKYLATMRQPVQRDVLMEILWPETAPQTANNRLKVAMHHLRQAFAPTDTAPDCRDCILFGSGCYFLNPDFEIQVDMEMFERSWQTGLQLERAGRLADAIPFYLQAEALYGGDFLEEDRLEEWTLVRREALKDTFLTILDKLSRYWFKTNHPQRAIEGWKKILHYDPSREDTYRQLMICLASCGQRAVAMRWYEVCARVLRQQLDLEPEPETRSIYETIRTGKPLNIARAVG